jgi:hypothetical protein
MSREQLDQLLDEIRARREKALLALNDVSEEEFSAPTEMERWSEVRRLLLRFGDHMREHATQLEGIRVGIERLPTMAQRILAESERSWGVLLASTVGLTDEDLDTQPRDGWTVRQTLEHTSSVEQLYLDKVMAALVEVRNDQE